MQLTNIYKYMSYESFAVNTSLFSVQLSDVFGGYLFQAVNTWPQFLWVISELDNHTKWVII